MFEKNAKKIVIRLKEIRKTEPDDARFFLRDRTVKEKDILDLTWGDTLFRGLNRKMSAKDVVKAKGRNPKEMAKMFNEVRKEVVCKIEIVKTDPKGKVKIIDRTEIVIEGEAEA